MRRLLLFLAAASLAAAVAKSQDESSDLAQRIDGLADELERRIAARKKAMGDVQPAPVAYEVGDICGFLEDQEMLPTRLLASGEPPPRPRALGRRRQRFEQDFLIEIIRSAVCPEAWDIGGVGMDVGGDRIVVRHLPHVQRGAAALLERIRALVQAQVAIDLVAVPVTPETEAIAMCRPRELSAEEAARILALDALGSVRIVCRDGHQVVQRNGRSVAYVARDVRAEDRGGGTLPIQADVFAGCAAQVRACLDPGGGGAVLHCRLELTSVDDPVRRVETPAGAVDLPVLRFTRVETSLWAPLDRTIVIGGGAVGGQGCLFLATVRTVLPGR